MRTIDDLRVGSRAIKSLVTGRRIYTIEDNQAREWIDDVELRPRPRASDSGRWLMSLIVVTGLVAEARIAASTSAMMIVGGGRADRLAAELTSAIASGARRLLSFGLAGGLAPHLRAGDLLVAENVQDEGRRLSCDPIWRSAINRRLAHGREPYARSGAWESSRVGLFRFGGGAGWRPIENGGVRLPAPDIAGVDAPVVDVASKRSLFAKTGAAAVDMESAIVARAARRHGLPFAILRVIVDPAHRPLPNAAVIATDLDGRVDVSAALGSLVRHPRQAYATVRLGFDARKAFASLVRGRALLGPDFASRSLDEVRTTDKDKREHELIEDDVDGQSAMLNA
jgi:adenosylhomocysteine nucleosidase